MPPEPQQPPPAPDAAPPARPTSRAASLALRAFFFLLGLGLLLWCGSIAFGPENREHLEKLRRASPAQIAWLMACSLASLALNGLIFRETLRPVFSIRRADAVAVNALAAFLAYLPMKASLLLRVGVHNRRDRVPLLTIGAWFLAVAVVLLATLGSLTLASLASKDIRSPAWIATAGACLAGGFLAIVLGSRLLAGAEGLGRLRALARATRLNILDRLLASRRFREIHAGAQMLASPTAVGSTMLLRVGDIAVQALRVPIAAGVLGLGLPFGDAFVIASAAFIVGLVSPAGPVGAREAAVLGVCKLLHIPDADSFAIVALLVTATEAIAYALGALAGLFWMGPTRLFLAPSATPGR